VPIHFLSLGLEIAQSFFTHSSDQQDLHTTKAPHADHDPLDAPELGHSPVGHWFDRRAHLIRQIMQPHDERVGGLPDGLADRLARPLRRADELLRGSLQRTVVFPCDTPSRLVISRPEPVRFRFNLHFGDGHTEVLVRGEDHPNARDVPLCASGWLNKHYQFSDEEKRLIGDLWMDCWCSFQ
jgi:hypothetical protein